MIKGVKNISYGEILVILGELYREGETGTLLCQSGAIAKYLYLQSGQVIFAASNSLEDKFTQILLEEGKLKEEQIDMAMEKKGSKTIAKTLTELGFISSADLIDSLIKQVYRIASSILNWQEGTATFKPDSLPPGVAKLPLSTQRLILDLARSIENRHYVMQIIGGIDKIVSITKAEMDVVLGLPLNPDEIKMVNAVDEKRTIENIAAIAQSNPFTASKFFLGLYYLGLAHPKKVIEPVNDLSKEETHTEDKKLDLSFLDKALPTVSTEEKKEIEESKKEESQPFQTIVPESETFKPLTIDENKETPLLTEETSKEEEKKEKEKEVNQPLLFSPTTLPPEPEEEKVFSLSEEPKIHLPPPNLLPRKKRSKIKMMAVSAGTIVVIVAVIFGILFLFEENEKKTPPPPTLPKIEPPQTKQISNIDSGISQNKTVEEKKEEEKPPLESSLKLEQEKKLEEKTIQKPAAQEERKVEENKIQVSVPIKEEKTSTPVLLDPFESLLRGNYEDAARAFKSVYSSKKGGFTIAIMLACEKDSISKALVESNNSKDLIIFPYNFKGRNCFRVIWGYYRTRQEAENAFANIPKVFKDSGAKVVGFETMKP